MSISIVIPAYNEEKTIARILDLVLERVQNLGEIIIIDDGSKDHTRRICLEYERKHPLIRYHLQPQNAGKTEALKAGFKVSTGDVVIVQDADLEYDPAEINTVVAPIMAGKADVVLGSRFLERQTSHSVYLQHTLANRFITAVSNLFNGLKLTDVETCYKALRGDIIRNMIITSERFGFEVEVMAKVAKLKCRVLEVPISYQGRSYQEGKKIGFKDGVMALLYIVKYNLFTSKKDSFRNL